MKIENALVFTEDGIFKKGDIYINNGIFTESAGSDDSSLDAEGLYAIPGLFDIHFHGCMGYDFCDGTTEALDAITAYQKENGITSICPASMTLPEDVLAKVFSNAKNYHSTKGADLCGINMEGPYVSAEKKGAQNGSYIVPPNVEMFRRLQKEAGGMIKLVAIAPETENAIEFIRALKDETVLSVAHTTADYETASKAFLSGATHVTHLFNAMPPFSHRAPGVVGAALDCKDAYVEMICDGIHIHPSMVRAAFDMFSDDRIILISDSMMAAGMPDGIYSLGGQEVHVKGRLAVLKDGTIAGSASNLMDCLRTAVLSMGIPLESAVKCAAANPAKAVGLYNQYGSIAPGKKANLVLLDKNLEIVKVIKA